MSKLQDTADSLIAVLSELQSNTDALALLQDERKALALLRGPLQTELIAALAIGPADRRFFTSKGSTIFVTGKEVVLVGYDIVPVKIDVDVVVDP